MTNKEYTTQTVFYLLISFRHLFIILIRIFNHYNLIPFIRSLSVHDVLCKMTVDAISVQYMLITYRESPTTLICIYNVASGLDAHSSSYIVGDISLTILIW